MGVACAGGACRQPAPEPPGTGNRDPRRNLLRFLINLVRIQHILGPSYPGGLAEARTRSGDQAGRWSLWPTQREAAKSHILIVICTQEALNGKRPNPIYLL